VTAFYDNPPMSHKPWRLHSLCHPPRVEERDEREQSQKRRGRPLVGGSDHLSIFQLKTDQLKVRDLNVRPDTFRERLTQERRGVVASIPIGGYTRRHSAKRADDVHTLPALTVQTWQSRD
jgi:hypothetical protein